MGKLSEGTKLERPPNVVTCCGGCETLNSDNDAAAVRCNLWFGLNLSE